MKPLARAVIIGGVGTLSGFLLGWLAKKPFTEWKEKNGFDPEHRLHHADIGAGMATLGFLATSKNPESLVGGYLGPGAMGLGVGLALEDYSDYIGIRPFRALDKPNVETILPEVDWKDVPNFPSQLRYAGMAREIRKIVLEDTHHPEVRKTAEDIIRTVGCDGRDYDAILSAMQLWIRENITYVHDPEFDKNGQPTDRYAHAYITLPKSDSNPKGTACGDCDDLFIVLASMASSVGIPNVYGMLVDQTGKGYQHILPVYIPELKGKGKPKNFDDIDIAQVIGLELTENRPYGWIPEAKSYGFMAIV